MPRHLLLTAALAAASCFVQPAVAQVNLGVVIGVPPPPVVVEPPPPPRVGFAWAPGYWYWDGGRHLWYPGHWEPNRAGEIFIGARWLPMPGGWQFFPGHWEHRHHHDYEEGGFCPPGQAKKGRC